MKIKFLTSMALLVYACNVFSFELQSISDVISVQQRPDGKYDLICKDGSREIDTDLDIKLDNICPKLTSSEELNILSVQKREDGNFDVYCKDLTRKVATKEQILSGEVCKVPPPSPSPAFSILEGKYNVSNASSNGFCDNYFVKNTSYQNNQIVSFSMTCPDGYNLDGDFTCDNGECKNSSQRKVVLTQNEKSKFTYYMNSSTSAVLILAQ